LAKQTRYFRPESGQITTTNGKITKIERRQFSFPDKYFIRKKASKEITALFFSPSPLMKSFPREKELPPFFLSLAWGRTTKTAVPSPAS